MLVRDVLARRGDVGFGLEQAPEPNAIDGAGRRRGNGLELAEAGCEIRDELRGRCISGHLELDPVQRDIACSVSLMTGLEA